MSEQENLRTVRGIFESFGRGDVPAILQVLAEDVEWTLAGAADVSYTGIRRGHSGVVQFFTALGTSVEFEKFEPQEFINGDNCVVVLGTERGRVRATGKSFDNDWAMIFKLAGGRVTSYRCYEDSAAVAEAFRQS